jgi:hypothetical protein
MGSSGSESIAGDACCGSSTSAARAGAAPPLLLRLWRVAPEYGLDGPAELRAHLRLDDFDEPEGVLECHPAVAVADYELGLVELVGLEALEELVGNVLVPVRHGHGELHGGEEAVFAYLDGGRAVRDGLGEGEVLLCYPSFYSPLETRLSEPETLLSGS